MDISRSPISPSANLAPTTPNPNLPGEAATAGALPAEINAAMEASLGADFSSVNIHNEPPEVADQMDAKSYTLDSEIHFSPENGLVFDTPSSGALTAHELTHVTSLRAGLVDAQDDPSAGELVIHELKQVENQGGWGINTEN